MTTVNLSDELVNEAKRYAKIESRSIPKQIEYWARLGRAARDNTDLPILFIMDMLEAVDDPVTMPFEFTIKKEIKPTAYKRAKAKSIPKRK